jgi:hypothetical protein
VNVIEIVSNRIKSYQKWHTPVFGLGFVLDLDHSRQHRGQRSSSCHKGRD